MSSLRIRSFGVIAFAVVAFAGPLAGVALAVPPSASPAPVITPAGTGAVGQQLNLTQGTWSGDEPIAVSDLWVYCTSSDASTCSSATPVSGAPTTSYTPVASDEGKYIAVIESGTNTETGAPTTTTVTSTSNVVGPVVGAPTHGPITLGGTPAQGAPLTSDAGSTNWTNSPTTTDQWYDCTTKDTTACSPVAGTGAAGSATSGTGTTYTIQASDVNQYIYLKETATNAAGTGTANSNVVGPVVGPPTRGALTISNAATQGTTLTSNGGSASWTNAPTTADQWYDCPTNRVTTACDPVAGTGAAGSATSGTATTYTLQAGDVSQYLYLNETATNAAGTATANSNILGPVVAVPVSDPTNPPSISGSTITGLTLTANHGTWSASPTAYAYQWMRCTTTCSNVGAASATSTYPLTSADQGDTIEVSVTATNTAGTSAAVTSSAVGPVVPPAPTYSVSPGISGTAESGQKLTETPAVWHGNSVPPTIQWYRCAATCTAVTGATGKTYALTDADVGAQMLVTETATNAGGSTTVPSSLTAPVTKNGFVPAPVVTSGSAPTVAGPLALGRALTASSASFANNPNSFSYQWQRCNALGCSAIPGETDVTYTPTSADVGDSIAVIETASNSGGPSKPVPSAHTGTVTAPSTTALQTNTAAPFAGQGVTLIATVTSAAGSVKPAGTVDFHTNGAVIPGCAGLALGTSAPTAVCQTSFLASVANVTAVYSSAPGTFITGSTSSPTTLTVGRAVTSVTVAASAHVSLGAKTTYTATIHAPAGSTLTPTGRVMFTDSGKTIKACGNKALGAYGTPCAVTYLGIKQHRIAAHYSGDANFAPSASIASHVLVQPQAPRGFVAAAMYWSFGYSLHSTRIKSLTATGLSAGMRIALTCHGGGCPFATRAVTIVAHGKCTKAAKKKGCVAAPSFDLTSMFHRARLHVGTQLIVAVTHRSWIGKYYRFTIRKGRKPSTVLSCLAVNGTRPGVGCSAP